MCVTYFVDTSKSKVWVYCNSSAYILLLDFYQFKMCKTNYSTPLKSQHLSLFPLQPYFHNTNYFNLVFLFYKLPTLLNFVSSLKSLKVYPIKTYINPWHTLWLCWEHFMLLPCPKESTSLQSRQWRTLYFATLMRGDVTSLHSTVAKGEQFTTFVPNGITSLCSGPGEDFIGAGKSTILSPFPGGSFTLLVQR